MFYSPKYFSDKMPKWKKKKGTLIGRFLYRPISYVLSSFFSSVGIKANTISYFSLFVAVAGSSLFLFNDFVLAIIGASLINIWLLLDCVDGNMARCVSKQPFGEYADAISSYTLIPCMCLCVSIYAFNFGGILSNNSNIWIVVLGGVAGFSDTLMRLFYQKFSNNKRDLIDKGLINDEIDERKDHSKIGSFKNRIESIFSTYNLIFLIFAVVFNLCDIFILICFAFYSLSLIYTGLSLWMKARKYRNLSFEDENDKD